MAVADLGGTGQATAVLMDTSQPAGSQVLDAVTTDASGQLVETSSSSVAEQAAQAVAAQPDLSQPTTIPLQNGGTIVAQSGQ
jgi:hypothetical protein